MSESVINGSDLGALLPLSEVLRLAIVFKTGTSALTVLSEAVLLSEGQS